MIHHAILIHTNSPEILRNPVQTNLFNSCTKRKNQPPLQVRLEAAAPTQKNRITALRMGSFFVLSFGEGWLGGGTALAVYFSFPIN